MKTVVMKFGGTTLREASGYRKAAEIVGERSKSDIAPVVVVSASGREGEPYATDTLLKLVTDITPEIEARERDLLCSCGELISAVLFCQYLLKTGIRARAFSGAQAGIITDCNHDNCRIRFVNPQALLEALSENFVPVIAGFQGISEEGEITTLGRGGSDTTASAIAAALKSELIEIYTDVSGIMTADPVKVSKAEQIPRLSYREIVELAYMGAKVIHPRAVEIAAENDIPISIKDAGSPLSDSQIHRFSRETPVTAITSRSDIVFIRIVPGEKKDYNSCLDIFRELGKVKISVDFINIRPREISFVISGSDQNKTLSILERDFYDFECISDYVKISLTGNGMTGRPGVMAAIVDVLKKEDITIFETTDSHTSISCLIERENELKALRSLHKTMIESP